ncbi:MAG: transketolase [Oligoflexia bacterium]|nr:transketolase [Oligoflexia bacterium]
MASSENQLENLKKIANQLRIESIRATTAAGSGHPTSCCSAADIVAALFFGEIMRFDPHAPHRADNDRFILSKGHAAPLLYAAWAEAGNFPVEDLMNLRKIDSPLEGHPTPRADFVDVATGSLGQGLAAGLGMALESRLSGRNFNTFVLMGDGELAEGSVWEAASLAGVRRLSNLVAIVDANRLGQSQETAFGADAEIYSARFEAFGWVSYVIDGHDLGEILSVLSYGGQGTRPLAIIAQTIKGKGIPDVEGQLNWHGRALPAEMAEKAIARLRPEAASAQELGLTIPLLDSARAKAAGRPNIRRDAHLVPLTNYEPGSLVATREAFGNALVRMGEADSRVVTLDGDVGNSTHSREFLKRFPDRFFECYIAEQTMVGAASGLAALGRVPFVSTFAAFFSRAYDQIRMSCGISQLNIKLVGSHAGVSIGEDGPSQMGLEDIAIMRAVPGSVVLSPSDATATERLIEIMLEHRGFCYLRTTRTPTPLLYGPEEDFEIGGARILRRLDTALSPGDCVTVVATGVVVFEAVKASDLLASEGISVGVIDAYSIKPLARDLILREAQRTQESLITVEDHYLEGGLGDAVASELSLERIRVDRLAVKSLPGSGKGKELMARHKIDAHAIVQAVYAHLEARKSGLSKEAAA